MRGVAALVAVVLGATGCGAGGGQPGPSEAGGGVPVLGGTLIDLHNWANGPGAHIDPALASTAPDAQIGHLLFDGLTAYDHQTGQLRPAVAESWQSNHDATVWTFRLRRGVTWSNGEPVLPSDFKFAWNRAVGKDLASLAAYHFTDNARIRGASDVAAGTAVEAGGIVADDADLTLTVELEAPLSFFPDVVAHVAFSPVPRNVVAALPDHTKWEHGLMVGNGPFRMAAPWRPDEGVRLVRRDGYWGGVHGHEAYVDAIEFRVSKDADAAWAAFEAGQGDTAYTPPARFGEARAKYPGRVADQPVNAVYFWTFNAADPVVGGPQNLKLRQAISLAVDKQKMVHDIYNGSRRVATAVTPPGIPGFKPGLSRFATRDLGRARELLAEWERETGHEASALPPLELNFGQGAGHAEHAVILQANLAELGIDAVLDPIDPRTYFRRMHAGEGQFFRSGWGADYNAYDNMLWPLFGSGSGDNHSRWSSRTFDSLIAQARATIEPAERHALYHQAESLVLNDAAVVVPLNWYSGTVTWSDRVHNLVQGALQFIAYDELWVTPR